jgi:hypothetical protein
MRLRYVILAAAAMASVASGCGGDDNGSSAKADKAALEDDAAVRVERSAKAVADRVHDKYLPGPRRMEAVCTAPDLPEGVDTGYQITCHVESYAAPQPGIGTLFIWSEDWTVPVDQNGALGKPVISGEYRIKNYLRKDNRLDCTNRTTRPEVCTGQLSLKDFRRRQRFTEQEKQQQQP